MSSDKNGKPIVPIIKPEVGRIWENSQKSPRQTPNKLTKPTLPKKGK